MKYLSLKFQRFPKNLDWMKYFNHSLITKRKTISRNTWKSNCMNRIFLRIRRNCYLVFRDKPMMNTLSTTKSTNASLTKNQWLWKKREKNATNSLRTMIKLTTINLNKKLWLISTFWRNFIAKNRKKMTQIMPIISLYRAKKMKLKNYLNIILLNKRF